MQQCATTYHVKTYIVLIGQMCPWMLLRPIIQAYFTPSPEYLSPNANLPSKTRLDVQPPIFSTARNSPGSVCGKSKDINSRRRSCILGYAAAHFSVSYIVASTALFSWPGQVLSSSAVGWTIWKLQSFFELFVGADRCSQLPRFQEDNVPCC